MLNDVVLLGTHFTTAPSLYMESILRESFVVFILVIEFQINLSAWFKILFSDIINSLRKALRQNTVVYCIHCIIV